MEENYCLRVRKRDIQIWAWLLISDIVCSVHVGQININAHFRFYVRETGWPLLCKNTHPIMYMSVFPSPTFSPSKEVMSSGGVAEPTFQVMMCTLLGKMCYLISIKNTHLLHTSVSQNTNPESTSLVLITPRIVTLLRSQCLTPFLTQCARSCLNI